MHTYDTFRVPVCRSGYCVGIKCVLCRLREKANLWPLAELKRKNGCVFLCSCSLLHKTLLPPPRLSIEDPLGEGRFLSVPFSLSTPQQVLVSVPLALPHPSSWPVLRQGAHPKAVSVLFAEPSQPRPNPCFRRTRLGHGLCCARRTHD